MLCKAFGAMGKIHGQRRAEDRVPAAAAPTAKSLQSCHWLCATPSLEFSRQEHWSGLPFPSPTESLSPSIFSVWIQFSHAVVLNSLWPHGMQHARLTCPSPIPGTSSNSCPSSQWCHPAISSSAIPFSSCLQSLPASESFPMSQLFISGGQSIRASAPVLPMNVQDWFPSGLTYLVSLLSKGLSRVFSSTIKNHQFF